MVAFAQEIDDIYARAADQIVIFHFALVVSIILYQLALPLGLWFRAGWARNFWIRAVHFSIMAYIGFEGAVGHECPLTIWERGLRLAEMDDATRVKYYEWEYDPLDTRPWLARLAHRSLLYRLEPDTFAFLGLSNDSFFHWVHLLFGAIVILTWVLGPPDWPWIAKKTKSNHPPASAAVPPP